MKDINIFNKFSKHLKTILVKAQELSSSLSKKEIDFWEILYALTLEKGSVAFSLLSNRGFKAIDFKNEAVKIANLEKASLSSKTKKKDQKINIPMFSNQAQQIIEKAVKIAYQNKHAYIGSEHLLSAILESNVKELNNFLKKKKINQDELKEDLKNMLLNTSKLNDLI